MNAERPAALLTDEQLVQCEAIFEHDVRLRQAIEQRHAEDWAAADEDFWDRMEAIGVPRRMSIGSIQLQIMAMIGKQLADGEHADDAPRP